ncbi:beta-glucan synthesis-associated [Testicularia cyperi]|uniref:Beta-glucan synthesis-associated n=1 Tax=Testicularia cyperi TaxID=1882483 RepID=A0A317XHY7_9BASI|nr:beta-glucan synthesis-associated [Testicularia cyperi]
MSQRTNYESVPSAQQPQQPNLPSYKKVYSTPAPGQQQQQLPRAAQGQRPPQQQQPPFKQNQQRPGPRGAPSNNYNNDTSSGSFSSGDSGSSQRLLKGSGGMPARQASAGRRGGAAAALSSHSNSNESAGIKYDIGGPNAPLYNGPEDDDDLHDWRKESHSHAVSWRGISNVLTLLLLAIGLLALFAGYPIISHYEKLFTSSSSSNYYNIGGTNGSGQVPDLPLFSLVDPDTPQSATTRTSPVDGKSYHLVFSDEFNLEGRTFWPGDDPFWEAIDLYYGVTGDYEYYSPEAVNTTNGALTITMTEKQTHNLNFQSGMLQSWNKFCFQGGYIEFSMRMPGTASTSGYWPGLWLMGNLGRPGYPGSTDGMWPYSYAACDTGILANQTFTNKTGPDGAINSNGRFAEGGRISYLPGMRSSSCTCPGEDHPGPTVNVARSSPELDILEAQIQVHQGESHGFASQSYQVAPFDQDYEWTNTSSAARVYDDTVTTINSYKGNVYQEAVSSLTQIPDSGYVDSDNQFVKYGVEYQPDWNENGGGSIVWYVDGKPSWSVNGKAMPANPKMDISVRTISVEPMTIIMNLGMSKSFQPVNFGAGGVAFPAVMSVDYVRVYQLDGQSDRISCDPADHPTAQYIADHPDLYYNPNLTVYNRAWPKNRLTGC